MHASSDSGCFRLAAIGMIALAAAASVHAQIFTDLRPQQFSSIAGVTSANGQPAVFGVGGDDTFITNRWTRSTGKVPLPALHTEPYPFIPEDVSASGKVIVGRGAGSDDPFRPSAYRWTQHGGLEELSPNIRDATFSVRTRVSADGTTVSGFGASAAFRWQRSTGTVYLGAKLDDIDVISPSNPLFFPNALSRDGSSIAGMNTLSPFAPGHASRWTKEHGLMPLGLLFGEGSEETSTATGISAKGDVIVGTAGLIENYNEAFRWTEQTGMVSLGILPGGRASYAVGIAGDGARVFGGTVLGSPFETEPFVWSSKYGMQRLIDLLAARGAGAELAGWDLTSITAFSNDGRFLVGRGVGPDGRQGFWLADIGASPIPEPAALGLLAGCGLLAFAALRRHRRRSATRCRANGPEHPSSLRSPA